MTIEDIECIRSKTGVSAMLSLQHDECLEHFHVDYGSRVRHVQQAGLVMVRCPMRDFDVPDMRRGLPAAVSALDALLRAQHRVYVHCTAGTGRSPLTVLGYLTFIEGYSPENALSFIKLHRSSVNPSWEAYYGCLHDLVERHRGRIAERAHELYAQGSTGGAVGDWVQAEREIIREVIRNL